MSPHTVPLVQRTELPHKWLQPLAPCQQSRYQDPWWWGGGGGALQLARHLIRAVDVIQRHTERCLLRRLQCAGTDVQGASLPPPAHHACEAVRWIACQRRVAAEAHLLLKLLLNAQGYGSDMRILQTEVYPPYSIPRHMERHASAPGAMERWKGL